VRRTFLALVCALAVTVSMTAVPAGAKPGGPDGKHGHQAHRAWTPTNGGFFNNPWGDRDQKFRIERQIVAAIEHARPGSYVRVAVYSFDRVNVARALLAAHRRGVRVQVLHNDHQYTPAMKMLKHGLGTHRGRKSWDYTCKTGCRSFQGVLHDKIYLFEHTGRARNVVMTGSANLTLNATVHQFNDLLVRKNVPALHHTFLQLFRELKKDRTARPLYQRRSVGDDRLWVMPHRHNKRRTDPVMGILRDVRCWGARGDTGTDGRTKIRVSMHAWNGSRGTWIAKRLRHLYARGCDVKVMWSLGGQQMKRVFEHSTRKHGRVPRRANGYNTDCDVLHEVDMYSHQKYLTISGWYGHDRSASYVFTGSSNWTASGISGDELILRAEGAGLVKDWNRNFGYIWKHRARTVGGSGGFRPGAPYCPYYYYRGMSPREATTTDLSFSGAHWEAD
jgi:phosphatidylserine/phosphatidylglycerophosphate/cardiolipin synthase-like enzyme